MIRLSVTIDNTSAKWNRAFPGKNIKIEQAVAAAFLRAKKPAAFARRHFEINILLTDNATIRNLNNSYLGKNKPTNVLSFPQLNMQKFRKTSLDIFPAKIAIPLGDVVLAHEVIQQEARLQKKTLESHVMHLVVHGVLHLLGHDHMRLKDAKIMEKLECDILRTLGYSDPYHEQPAQKR